MKDCKKQNAENLIIIIQGLEDYIRIAKKDIIAARNSTESIMIYRTTTRKQKWEQKQVFGYFKRQTSEISYVKS